MLDFGAAVPGGAAAIVAIAGRPGAYVVSDSVLADVRKKPGDWRDRQMFHGAGRGKFLSQSFSRPQPLNLTFR